VDVCQDGHHARDVIGPAHPPAQPTGTESARGRPIPLGEDGAGERLGEAVSFGPCGEAYEAGFADVPPWVPEVGGFTMPRSGCSTRTSDLTLRDVVASSGGFCLLEPCAGGNPRRPFNVFR
jgi:hypothetical protein